MRFLFLLLVSQSLFAAPRFLHLKGQAAGHNPADINREFQNQYLAPLEKAGTSIIFSQVSQSYGNGSFFFNVIVEAADPSAEAFVNQYVADREGGLFYGAKAHFQNVARILESADLEAGVYNDGRQDPFEKHAVLTRAFSFTSLAEWVAFTNSYGYALMNSNNAILMDYLRDFIGNDRAFVKFRDNILSVNNMLAVFPQVTLELEDGAKSGPEFESTPFLPYRFFRNCYSTRFEGGMCWKP